MPGARHKLTRSLSDALLICLLVMGLTGCAPGWQPSGSLVTSTQRGDHQVTREILRSQMSGDVQNLALDRVRLGMTELADGQDRAAETSLLAAYDLLRTRGVNEGLDARIFFSSEEDEKVWKGDPFEIAAAHAYFSAQLASVGDWGNARAAAGESLFLLADFEAEIEDDSGLPSDPGEPDGGDKGGEEDHGYQPVETNFAPGYFMAGLSSFAMGSINGDDRLRDEASDQFRRAVQFAPELAGLTQNILAGRINTVLWVDFGKGPEKYRRGNNLEFSEYRVMEPSGSQRLSVRVNGETAQEALPAADYNVYALDHRWRSSQGVRVAKGAIGDGLVIGGAVVAHNADSTGEAIAGLAAILVGMMSKNSAQADIRHNEMIPQRSYFVGAWIENETDTIELVVDGVGGSRMVLTGLAPSTGARAAFDSSITFRYVRLLDGHSVAPAWATSGEVLYANDEYTWPVSGSDLPYIFGGRCVRSPSERVFAEYAAGGVLPEGMTLIELKNLYRAEGITWELTDQHGLGERHVLEGGRSLVAPVAGSAGFARLFGQTHSEYVPRSAELQTVLEEWDINAIND